MWYCPKARMPPPPPAGLTEEDHKAACGMMHQDLGRCRRHAPTMSGYPVVMPTDWCGDHKLDENRI